MRPLQPVTTAARIESLDVLRGVALLGILVMNIRAMAAPFSAYMYPYALFEYDGASRAAFVFTTVFFDLKMMGLFSMLFGAGALLYAAKAGERTSGARGLWFRRMGWLLVIGLVHAYLIWPGDILVPYALCGLILLWWVRRLPAWGLATLAAVLLTIGAALSLAQGATWDSRPEAERAAELAVWMPTPEQARTQLAEMHGGYAEVVASRAAFVATGQTLYFIAFFFWRCSGMMLLGMALYKWGFLDGRFSPRTYAMVAAVCLGVGLALSWQGVSRLEAIRFAMPARGAADVWNYAGAVFTSVGYAAAVLAALAAGWLGGLRRRLAAVGQMAFTNYLSQSVLTSVLFLGWGIGLAGRFDYAEQLLVVAAIWILQLAWSPVWLARYRFGPAEWLWRSLTYWSSQPLRR